MSNDQPRRYVLTLRASLSGPDLADVLRDLRMTYGVESVEPLPAQPSAAPAVAAKRVAKPEIGGR